MCKELKETAMSIKILLVDDHEVLRSGLRSLIARNADMEVVAEAGTGRDAVRIAARIEPDVVVMDISLPDINGIEATRQILQKNPKIGVLALSMHSNPWYVEAILKAGGKGYVCKENSAEELINAIRTVHSGETFFSTRVGEAAEEEATRGSLTASYQ
jgi:DNA-binding NarL/FixJ family response regulator